MLEFKRTAMGIAIFASSVAACCANDDGEALAPANYVSTQARELGSIAASAELCRLDAPKLVSRQVGLQLAASLWNSPSPEQTLADLAAFSQAGEDFKIEYSFANESAKSRLCAFSWLGWRSMRDASSLTTGAPNLPDTVDLAKQTGGVHGWAWACQALQGLDGKEMAPLIARQSAASFAFAALSSSSPADLGKAHRAWAQGFASSLTDPKLEAGDCSKIDKSVPALSSAFESKARIETELKRAKKEREKLSGTPL
jgi:hypothetical protein